MTLRESIISFLMCHLHVNGNSEFIINTFKLTTLVGVQTCAASMEIAVAFPHEVRNRYSIQSSIYTTPGHIFKGLYSAT